MELISNVGCAYDVKLVSVVEGFFVSQVNKLAAGWHVLLLDASAATWHTSLVEEINFLEDLWWRLEMDLEAFILIGSHAGLVGIAEHFQLVSGLNFCYLILPSWLQFCCYCGSYSC